MASVFRVIAEAEMARRVIVMDTEFRQERWMSFSMFKEQHVLGGRGKGRSFEVVEKM